MNRRDLLVGAGATALGLGLGRCPLLRAAEGDAPKRRVLYLTKSAGFEHSAVKRTGEQPSYSEKVLVDIGPKNGFEITCTKDGSVFTADNLAKYDAYVFYTSGMLTEKGTDRNPPMPAEGKGALLDAIKNGKGFIGIHSATDSFHTSPKPEDRNKNFGDKVDPYIAMIGGEFISHGPQQKAKLTCADPKFPGCEALKDGVEWMEEWYAHKDFATDLHVILVQETQGMKGAVYQRPPFPATWAHMYGKGRVLYTSLGHREDIWDNPAVQKLLLGALSWATGNVNADVTPNIATAAPKCLELAPPEPPKPKK
ncbi:MAG: ThuA domain-containing protein [Planctomycetota bacterium]|nr:ThuA domain-containing protein [Planctomycetota bacterium]